MMEEKEMEKNNYIQLPDLNKEISMEELLCIWEFAKLPEEKQMEMCGRLERALWGGAMQDEQADDTTSVTVSKEVEKYMAASRSVIKQAMTEACQLAAFVYHECFVLGISAEELKQEFPGYEDYIDATVGYVHELFEKKPQKIIDKIDIDSEKCNNLFIQLND